MTDREMADTSLEAYRDGERSGTHEADRVKIMRHIIQRKGLTIFQAAKLMGKMDNRVSGRFKELERAGLIKKTNVRFINPETGKPCIVWVRRRSEA